jgi:hypothetical protein
MCVIALETVTFVRKACTSRHSERLNKICAIKTCSDIEHGNSNICQKLAQVYNCPIALINFYYSTPPSFYSEVPQTTVQTLLRGAPDYSADTESEFHAEMHEQLRVKGFSYVAPSDGFEPATFQLQGTEHTLHHHVSQATHVAHMKE